MPPKMMLSTLTFGQPAQQGNLGEVFLVGLAETALATLVLPIAWGAGFLLSSSFFGGLVAEFVDYNHKSTTIQQRLAPTVDHTISLSSLQLGSLLLAMPFYLAWMQRAKDAHRAQYRVSIAQREHQFY